MQVRTMEFLRVDFSQPIQMATGADFAYIHCDSAPTQKQERSKDYER